MEKTYQLRRLNAVKHGILSKEAVLPHESREEFEDLLTQYEADFVPANATERTLVEELASIVWRKKRLLKAENAKINNGLSNVLNLSQRLLNSSVPLSLHIEDEKIEAREFLKLSTEELEEKRKELETEEQKRKQAEEILSQGGKNCTKRAAACLGDFLLNLWYSDEYVQHDRYGLTVFLSGKAKTAIEEILVVANHVSEIKEQALGNAINQVNFDSFARYEAHLDRKYERTLAMLIKLKSLSGNTPPTP
ncbi:hypothetical protein [Turicimonas muris]|uniref:Uncharacterized protein n=1 Tax=Turicimonas muris TaxID=1796652 RepID=A0A227KR89_9BURK|nr:hypothetical protein [Turicimonas muris]ANU65226.1 hypothetical protein A4V04_01425 [Burkholderiales bacterium YL45]OXE51029.1 hypothetical protein ADH67_01660 [Turicimonas muris]QQQ96380.1 hypothetical protein I5Q81_10575 [Turicimonas muris]